VWKELRLSGHNSPKLLAAMFEHSGAGLNSSAATNIFHLQLYLAELDYKYNTRKATDGARTAAAIRLVEGKRLMYRDPLGK
jgi:hypothetical protein